jgi:hypothetical protein
MEPLKAGASGETSRFFAEKLTNDILEVGFYSQAMAKAEKLQKTSGRAGTRAHLYMEWMIEAIDKKLMAYKTPTGDRFGALSEIYLNHKGHVDTRRGKGTLGLDVLLFMNGMPFLGLDLKTGRSWTPKELRKVENWFGVPVLQFGLDKWRTK